MRVVVMGCSGAGKSTTSKMLADLYRAPIIHLDRYYSATGESWRSQVEQLLAQPSWVMDGNFITAMSEHIGLAEAFVILDMPRWLCMLRIFRRIHFGYGQIRATWRFRKRLRDRIFKLLENVSKPVVVLASRSDAERWIASGLPLSASLPSPAPARSRRFERKPFAANTQKRGRFTAFLASH